MAAHFGVRGGVTGWVIRDIRKEIEEASVQVVRAAVLIPNLAPYREKGEDIERDGDRGPRGCVT